MEFGSLVHSVAHSTMWAPCLTDVYVCVSVSSQDPESDEARGICALGSLDRMFTVWAIDKKKPIVSIDTHTHTHTRTTPVKGSQNLAETTHTATRVRGADITLRDGID